MGLITAPHRSVTVTGSHVFISHARDDLAYAQRLVTYLNSAGAPAWIDDALDAGDRWVSVLRGRLDACAALVVVMSPAAGESAWVEREIRRAEILDKPILPVLLSGTIFFRLADMHYEDVTGGALPSPGFVHKLRELLAAYVADEPRWLGTATLTRFRPPRSVVRALRSPLRRRAH
jgi:hypothetical protein